MDKNLHIADLIVKQIRGTIAPEERTELNAWIREDPEHEKLFQRASDPKQQLSRLEIYGLFDKERVWSALEDQLFPTRTVRFPSRRVLRYAAAILLPVLVAGGAWLFLLKPDIQTLADLDEVIRPGSQRAVLILSDGGRVTLDDDHSPSQISEGGTVIMNEQQVLDYFSEEQAPGSAMVYNELRTPRGGGYQLKLADGTRAWLNAGSSLKYPVSFQGSSREVILEGEAYFEVTPSDHPFIVHSGNMDVRVLGTTFNISAYPDEDAFMTTLVEGKVSVEVFSDEGITAMELAPNDQATVEPSASVITITEVNPSYYTSWMRGKIEFNNENLDMVMKQLARWYDFDYRFENPEAMGYHFTARLDRDASISSILEMLEMTTRVNFEFKEGTVVIR